MLRARQRKSLSPAVADVVGSELGALVAAQVEARVMHWSFSALGALKFDKALRSLVDALVTALGASCRCVPGVACA